MFIDNLLIKKYIVRSKKYLSIFKKTYYSCILTNVNPLFLYYLGLHVVWDRKHVRPEGKCENDLLNDYLKLFHI